MDKQKAGRYPGYLGRQAVALLPRVFFCSFLSTSRGYFGRSMTDCSRELTPHRQERFSVIAGVPCSAILHSSMTFSLLQRGVEQNPLPFIHRGEIKGPPRRVGDFLTLTTS